MAEIRDYLEVERAFAVAPPDLPEVLSALWPLDGLIVVGRTGYVITEVSLSSTIHLFGARTNGAFKERLKLRLNARRGIVEGFGEQKRASKGHEKEVSGSTGWMDSARTLRAIQELGEIRSCFFKERVKLSLEHGGTPSLEIGFDHLVPFDPKNPKRHGAPILHVEFEGEGVSSSKGLLRSSWFKNGVGKKLRLLEDHDTKWVLASSFSSGGRKLAFKNAAALVSFFESATKTLAPGDTRLLPIDLPSMKRARA